MNSQPKTAIQRIAALGKRVRTMSEAEVARAVGCSRERVRQLYVRLPYKPHSRQVGAGKEELIRQARESERRGKAWAARRLRTKSR